MAIFMCQLKRLQSQYTVSFNLSHLLFPYNFAVISNVIPKITTNCSDCHLPAEIVEVFLFGNNVDRCSSNLLPAKIQEINTSN